MYIIIFPIKKQALMRAAIHGHAECVRLLVECGADKNVQDDVRYISSSNYTRVWSQVYFDLSVKFFNGH